MSIVPKEVVASIAAAWNLECGETFAAHIADRAAQWALEQAAKVALKEAQDRFIYETYTQTMADAMVDAIRALISPEGNADIGKEGGE
jgi:hypothetical protein